MGNKRETTERERKENRKHKRLPKRGGREKEK